MASSSSSSSTSSFPKTSFKFDVFLSFRGEDTRNTFIGHLYEALKRESIETYKDDKNLERGKKISKELIQAIQDSRFHVIVFSKNYPSSSWCLDELVKIMQCQKTQSGQTVFPIFYDVEPTEVRKQSGAFGEAFAKCKKQDYEGKWRKALEDAASFSGWDLRTTADGNEVEFIKLVVKDISSKLPAIGADGNLIGMKTRINGVISSLNTLPDEFCMIGIAGMGGSGKTTLARAVFDQICDEFEGSSFVENVRECSNSLVLGLKSLQQQVLRDVLKKQDIFVNGVLEGKKEMKKKMHGIKVLVVLDDVDHIDQLKALAGEPNWFKPGSKIIITTRDKQVLVAHKVNSIHDVSLLTDEEAICLLSRCAFGKESPNPGYKELSRKVVSYAAGLPLTIIVLGSLLCDANEHVWIDTLERLEKIPLKETLQKLELSYMGLDDDCKEIFLHVACILKGWKKDDAIRALESCGFHAIRGLSVLEKKSLITVSEDDHRLGMHDHIEEMGRYIVRRSNLNEPGRHSRLWIQEEIKDILVHDSGSEATWIYLFARKVDQKTIMKGLRKMEKLRFLHVINLPPSCSELDEDNPFFIQIWPPISWETRSWELDEDDQYLPNSLQYLKWENYSLSVLPKKFQASNLVALEMPYNLLKHLCEGGERKVFHKLRFLELDHSIHLRTFDLGLTPNLEILNLEDCCNLVEFHTPLRCPKLKSLNLNNSKLSTLDLTLVPNIETLNLRGCSDLVELDIPCECPQLKFLNVSSPKLRSLDLSLVPNIETLNLSECYYLVELVMPYECPQLTSLNLSSSKLRSLDLTLVPNLETLNLNQCHDLVELHMPCECSQLTSLDLCCSKLRSLDLRLVPNLETLNLYGCEDLIELGIHRECPQLKSLNLNCPALRSLHLRSALNFETLKLEESGLVKSDMFLECPQLESLVLGISTLRTLDIGSIPNLETLKLQGCYNLVELHIHGECFKQRTLRLGGPQLRTLDIGSIPNLEKLKLQRCSNLVELCMHDECCKLRTLDLGCPQLRPFDLGMTRNLEVLTLDGHDDLVQHLISVRCPQLKDLKLNYSKLSTLELALNLKKLILESCDLVELHIPEGDVMLEYLNIKRCSKLKTLDLGRTPNLESLHLQECSSLVNLHAPIGGLKKLINFKAEDLNLRFKNFNVVKSYGLLPKLDLHGKLIDVCPLHPDDHFPKFQFECTYHEHLPSSIGNIEKLISVGFSCACTDLESFFGSICGLHHLRVLTLKGGILEAPKDLDNLQCLEELTFFSTKIKHLPDSICILKHLKFLKVYNCELLEKLPDDLGQLECLQTLHVEWCSVLRDIPNSICRMRSLKYFRLLYCNRVEELPEELGRLECLEELDIRGTYINDLPPSVLLLESLRILRSRDETHTTRATEACRCTVL